MTLYSRLGLWTRPPDAAPLGKPAARDQAVGIALDLGHPAVLDVDGSPQPTAQNGSRLDDPVCVGGSRDRSAAERSDRAAEPRPLGSPRSWRSTGARGVAGSFYASLPADHGFLATGKPGFAAGGSGC